MSGHPIIGPDRVEVLFDGSHELGEGSIWCGENLGNLANKFLYVDIYGPSKYASGPAVFLCDPFAPGGPTHEAYPLPSPCGTVVPDKSGDSVVVGLKDGFYRVDLKTKELTRLAGPDESLHGPEIRFNDGKCSPDGRFFCGSMKMLGPRDKEGSLFRLDPDGSLHLAYQGVSISNGLAWSHDNKTLYYIDTPEGCVFAFDYDSSSGVISNRRTAFHIPAGTGHPDGMTIDMSGRLWVAQWDGWRVVCYEITGEVVMEVKLPTAHVSSCAFIGPLCEDLVITTAKENMDADTRASQPLAGHTFIVRGVGAKGMPGCPYGQ